MLLVLPFQRLYLMLPWIEPGCNLQVFYKSI